MFPLSDQHISDSLLRLGIADTASATIRQIAALASDLEKAAGEPFVRLELGNPGLPAETVGIEAQCKALRDGVANIYPNIAGIPELKKNGARFLKAFFNIDVDSHDIIPTVGSMQGCFTLQLLLGQRIPGKDTILFIDPGFPAQKHQAKVLGLKMRSFDVYDYRGEALEAKLEEMLADGKVSAMIYSNPNNPAWINLTEQELEIIGRMATKHDAIVIEDLAYLGMDFRTDYSHPGQPPYIPTVAHYTDNYILMVSGSKIFSYAGERIAIVCMSRQVYSRQYDFLAKFYDIAAFGDAYVFGVLYTASSGTGHSAQHAFAAMLGAAADGKLDFVSKTSEYGRRAKLVKKAFTDNGFHIVYDLDGDTPISDGFFFTVGYPGFTSQQLQQELLKYGVSTIHLKSTGSDQAGVRCTVSMICNDSVVDTLRQRLAAFHEAHS